MSIRLQLRVFKTVEAVAFELFRHAGRWLAVAWLPWLLGTIAIIALQQIFVKYIDVFAFYSPFLVRDLENGWPPDWIQSLIFAPFTAMVFVAILKNILLRVPVSLRTLDLSRQTWLATVVLLGIAMLFAAIDWVHDRTVEQVLTATTAVEFYNWTKVLWAISLILKALVLAALYPFVAVVVEHGRIDLRAGFAILRRHFFGFAGLALSIGAVINGFAVIYSLLPPMLNLDEPAVFMLKPMRDALLYSFGFLLIWFPVDVLADVLAAITIGVTYKALRERLPGALPGSSIERA